MPGLGTVLLLLCVPKSSPITVLLPEDKGYFARGGKSKEAEKVLLDAATEQAERGLLTLVALVALPANWR